VTIVGHPYDLGGATLPLTPLPPGGATGAGRAPGTFGELLQGALSDPPVDFLVTLPINAGSSASFLLGPEATGLAAAGAGRGVTVFPPDRAKARALAELLLARHGVAAAGELSLHTDLPLGKGLASSSADLVATARAVGRAVGRCPSPAEIEDLMRSIEPSDGVMHPGTVAFCHREVRLLEPLGPLPGLTIVGVDEGGDVDTIKYNRGPRWFTDGERHEYGRLLDALRRAIPRHDTRTIGAVASRSADMHQRRHPKRLLAEVAGLCRSAGGRGVVAAHSGTMLGVLLDEADPAHPWRLQRVLRACAGLGATCVYRSREGDHD
jgi:L-threonine kinase